MSIIVMQTFKAGEGNYNELAQIISTMLVDTAARKGAEMIRAAGDPADGVVTIFQQWDNAENQQAYAAWRMENTDASRLIAVLREPPKIERLTHLF